MRYLHERIQNVRLDNTMCRYVTSIHDDAIAETASYRRPRMTSLHAPVVLRLSLFIVRDGAHRLSYLGDFERLA
jgi:hypothetical protein